MIAQAPAQPLADRPGHGLLRQGPVDAWLLAATAVQSLVTWGALALASQALVPAILAVALGLWWNANTVAHVHLHRPLFTHRPLNRALSVWLSVLLGFPQVVWRHRHLWHHAGEPKPGPPLRWSGQGRLELLAVALSWTLLAVVSPRTFLFAWLPGYALGMALCQAQGHFEHRHRGQATLPGVSHYNRWYNSLWFNDGFHVEHHRAPSVHWTGLPALRDGTEPHSAWPPVLRWLEALAPGGAGAGHLLVLLERLALGSPLLQRWLVRRHRQAFAQVLRALPQPPRHVVVVGGGLFPRTLAVLRPLLPAAQLTVIEADLRHIEHARQWLSRHDPGALPNIQFHHGRFEPATAPAADLLVLPLAYVGEVSHAVASAGCPVLQHAWLWQRGGVATAVVSPWLGKRVILWAAKSTLGARVAA